MAHNKTTFQRIWDDELPSWPIFRSDTHGVQVLLDIYPAHPGHVLIIPREPVDHVFELDMHRHLQLFAVAKITAERIQAALGAKRVKYVVSGYDIAHVHIHVLPSFNRGDVEEAFEARTRVHASQEELLAMQQILAFTPELIAHTETELAKLVPPAQQPAKNQVQ